VADQTAGVTDPKKSAQLEKENAVMKRFSEFYPVTSFTVEFVMRRLHQLRFGTSVRLRFDDLTALQPRYDHSMTKD